MIKRSASIRKIICETWKKIQTSAKYTLKKQNQIGWLSVITDRKEEVLVHHRQSIIALASSLAPSWLLVNRVVSRHIFIYVL